MMSRDSFIVFRPIAFRPTVARRAAWLSAASAAAFGLAACATYDMGAAEPVPLGDGVYTIAAEPGIAAAAPHSGAYQRATRFCFEQGKQLLRLEGPAGTASQAGGSLQFRCVGPGEPGWKQPVG